MSLQALFDSFNGKRVLILGDVMIDAYLHGAVNRMSPEAPVPVVDFQKEEQRIGGAGNVAARPQLSHKTFEVRHAPAVSRQACFEGYWLPVLDNARTAADSVHGTKAHPDLWWLVLFGPWCVLVGLWWLFLFGPWCVCVGVSVL